MISNSIGSKWAEAHLKHSKMSKSDLRQLLNIKDHNLSMSHVILQPSLPLILISNRFESLKILWISLNNKTRRKFCNKSTKFTIEKWKSSETKQGGLVRLDHLWIMLRNITYRFNLSAHIIITKLSSLNLKMKVEQIQSVLVRNLWQESHQAM